MWRMSCHQLNPPPPVLPSVQTRIISWKHAHSYIGITTHGRKTADACLCYSSSSPKNITILNPISIPKRSRTISTLSLTENYPTLLSHGPAPNKTCIISSSGSKSAIWLRYRRAWPSGQSPKTTSPTDAVITLRTCVISITPKHHYPLSNGSLIFSIRLLLIPPNWMIYAAKSAGHSAVNKKIK